MRVLFNSNNLPTSSSSAPPQQQSGNERQESPSMRYVLNPNTSTVQQLQQQQA